MLSVCIPIFNQDVRKLVIELVNQCQRAGIRYQILCFDDASKEKYRKVNRRLSTVYGVSYLEFPENLGRAKMRNKLGFHGMYDHLLFLDCDSLVVTKKFIRNYVEGIGKFEVMYGGTRYQKKEPKSTAKRLHWRYGQYREVLTLDRRLKDPVAGFRSNNFLISRDVFLKYPFDEKIEGYGHEDTLFAQSLDAAGYRIHHIDNAVKHGGLEKNSVFLGKVQESIENLINLRKRNLRIETRLGQLYSKLEYWSLLSPLIYLLTKLKPRMERHLLGSNPKMWVLDLWKLHTYHAVLLESNQNRK